MRKLIRIFFESEGYTVVAECSTADEGIAAYKELKPDIITMDLCMPKKGGAEAIKTIHDFDENAKILVCSGLGQELLVTDALHAGASKFLLKPFELDDFVKKLKEIFML